MIRLSILFALAVICVSCAHRKPTEESSANVHVASEMVDFVAFQGNPVFKGTGENTWDEQIRERGYILKEGENYFLWYTGYKRDGKVMHLGLATSTDGINWERYANNPIYDSGWVEDMIVVKKDSVYYMFAEGENDIAHLLTSTDKIHWREQGPLPIRYTNGKPLSAGPYGTPAAWYEGDTWYLLYERGDLGIWLATSTDLKTWTNKQDEPVLTPGPEPYDKFGVAVNQVVKHQGRYYAYYHATAFEDWHEWSSCVATSDDLIHWEKYDKNPIQGDDKSSPITVEVDGKLRLYTMHPAVQLHYPK